jgi:hypothetical protein
MAKQMNYKKGFIIPLLVALVAVLAIGGGYYYVKNTKKVEGIYPINATSTIVGNDRDAHGCIGSAGYSWCEVKNKCLRPWEEKCEATSTPISTCNCPASYIQDGNSCNPKCYYNNPRCLIASIQCTAGVKSCTPNWTCGWAPCQNGYQGMTAVDSNNCGLPSTGVQIACPALARQCSN